MPAGSHCPKTLITRAGNLAKFVNVRKNSDNWAGDCTYSRILTTGDDTMTEDEALTKWCPFVRLSHVNAPTGGNRYYHGVKPEGVIETTRCIGSQCMAFRWEYDSEYQVFTDNDGNRFEANTVGRLMDAKENNYKPFIPEHGYCGLAGKS